MSNMSPSSSYHQNSDDLYLPRYRRNLSRFNRQQNCKRCPPSVCDQTPSFFCHLLQWPLTPFLLILFTNVVTRNILPTDNTYSLFIHTKYKIFDFIKWKQKINHCSKINLLSLSYSLISSASIKERCTQINNKSVRLSEIVINNYRNHVG